MSYRSDRPTLFFDRDVGKRLPEALSRLRLPVDIEMHRNYFAQGSSDNEWLPVVGARGWVVIGHDRRHHTEEGELASIIDHNVRDFYLWGGSAPTWEKARCFLRAFEAIQEAILEIDPPFIFDVLEDGRLRRVPIS